jgi:hypothetical protein
MKSAKTSPHRCPLCSEFAKDCTAMMPPCTTLDHTVNQMRLKCASGPFLEPLRCRSLRSRNNHQAWSVRALNGSAAFQFCGSALTFIAR